LKISLDQNSEFMENWVLDLIVNDAQLKASCVKEIHGPLWLVISADGLSLPFSTASCSISSGLQWNCAARLLLKIRDIQNANLYVTLCTYGPSGEGAVALARSRVGLRSLPMGLPRQFRFPLMRSQYGAQEVAKVRLQATLSALDRLPHSYTDATRAPPDVSISAGPMSARV
jgi:hypothetical protein